jgi:hypothetical protein
LIAPVAAAGLSTGRDHHSGPDLDHAAWFTTSPTPGQPGPAVIEGHVDIE